MQKSNTHACKHGAGMHATNQLYACKKQTMHANYLCQVSSAAGRSPSRNLPTPSWFYSSSLVYCMKWPWTLCIYTFVDASLVLGSPSLSLLSASLFARFFFFLAFSALAAFSASVWGGFHDLTKIFPRGHAIYRCKKIEGTTSPSRAKHSSAHLFASPPPSVGEARFLIPCEVTINCGPCMQQHTHTHSWDLQIAVLLLLGAFSTDEHCKLISLLLWSCKAFKGVPMPSENLSAKIMSLHSWELLWRLWAFDSLARGQLGWASSLSFRTVTVPISMRGRYESLISHLSFRAEALSILRPSSNKTDGSKVNGLVELLTAGKANFSAGPFVLSKFWHILI